MSLMTTASLRKLIWPLMNDLQKLSTREERERHLASAGFLQQVRDLTRQNATHPALSNDVMHWWACG